MSIFHRIYTRDERMNRVDGIVPVEVELFTGPTGNIHPYVTSHNKEWVLELKLEQRFWANDVQRSDVEPIAMRALAAELYRDVLMHLPMLRLCIMSDDKIGAMDAASRIEKATQP